ncbi:hypothetical protein NZL82_14055 [Sphingomonas sanguinis]|uniref:hypothetical protein n=1 Tax=Sphingomonas sp. LC-1 TaxID=3110957 RepID=UPI0021BA93DC|nr:hypothetical protein [Sphingomonas sp. LC-1]MCT8003000.1 hypothetical protein [Sphingomonas sp. LC-1]
MIALKLVRLWPFAAVAAMGLWVARVDHLRADYRLTLTNERAAWTESIAAADRARMNAQAGYADRLASAAQGYAADLANRQPIILRSRDTVTRYEQTDAGRALCLAAYRVRGAAEDRNALFADPSRPTEGGGGRVPPIPADDPG